MFITQKCRRLMAFVMAFALVLSVLFISAPKEAKADDGVPSVTVLGATIRLDSSKDYDNDGKQSMMIGIRVDNANKASACAIRLTSGGRTYTIATDATRYAGESGTTQATLHSKDEETKSIVYAVVVTNIPEANYYSTISILGKVWDMNGNMYTSETADKNVMGVVYTIADKFPELNISIIGGSLYKNGGESKLTAEDLSGYSEDPDPEVTSNPLATPAPTPPPSELNLTRAAFDNSSMGRVSNGVVYVNDTGNDTTFVKFPFEYPVNSNEHITVVVEGWAESSDASFRMYVADGWTSGSNIVVNNLSAGYFRSVLEFTANDRNGNTWPELRIRGGNGVATHIKGLEIDEVNVYYTDRGAVVPAAGPTPTPRATSTPTIAPATPTPTAVSTPTATPEPGTTVIDLKDDFNGTLPSGVSFDETTGEVHITSAISEQLDFNMGFQAMVGETVEVHITGTIGSGSEGFRCWPGYGADCMTPNNEWISVSSTGNFDVTKEMVIYDKDGRNHPYADIITIKAIRYGATLSNMVISSLTVKRVESQATPTPTVRPATATPASATATPLPDMSGPINLSAVTGDSVQYASYNSQSGSLLLNDTSNNTTTIWFPLPGTIYNGETVTISIAGSVDSTCNGFRAWIGSGSSSDTQTIQMINNLSAGSLERTFTLKATADCNMLTIKSTSWDAGPVRGLTINSIYVFYTERGAAVVTPTPGPTPTPSPVPTATPLPTATPVVTQPPGDGTYKWVTTWGTAEEKNDVSSDRMPKMALNGTTVRQIIRVTTSGDAMKLRLSNQYGRSAVTINSLHVAKQVDAHASTIDPSTDTVVTVGGSESFTIPAGQVIETDGFGFSVNALENVAISAYFGSSPTSNITGHRGARATSYQVSGNHVSTTTLTNTQTTTSWFFLADASIWSPADSKAIVCFGDSITDGYGTDADYLGRVPDSYTRWGDYFAQRLQANAATQHVSVINEGIGSNGMLGSYPTDAGKDRFSRDLLQHDGVAYCIILFGVNDLNNLGNTSKYNQMIPEYQKMVTLCHNNGIKCYGAPILPFGTSSYYSASSEQVRTMINNWMRSSESQMDGIIDFESAVADPSNPINILPAYTHDDGLHPYDGYDVMANAIDLSMFE